MSRARHHAKKAEGGGVVHWNAGKDQPAAKEAEEKKRGGKVHMKGEGEKGKHRADRRARGGSVPGRKRGGGVGADKMPLTTAAKIKEVTKGEYAEDTPKND